MYEKLIETYVNKLTKDDIINFSNKQNIILQNYEINIIYAYIKKYWKIIYKGNPSSIFLDLKNNVNPNTYNKILELYGKYKNKI